VAAAPVAASQGGGAERRLGNGGQGVHGVLGGGFIRGRGAACPWCARQGRAVAVPWRSRPLAEGRAQMGPVWARGWANADRVGPSGSAQTERKSLRRSSRLPVLGHKREVGCLYLR
jgi:hypothetical protein